MAKSPAKSIPHLVKCPKQLSGELPHGVLSHGKFLRRCDLTKVKRFYCKACKVTFSEATVTFEFRQKKRDINLPLFKQLSSNTSMRRSAILVGTTRKTVARRFAYFDKVAMRYHTDLLNNMNKVGNVQFDDMESSIHTKLKPVSIPLAVEHPSRIILGISAASMPAKGHHAELSRRKYGKRLDERRKAWTEVLSQVAVAAHSEMSITSDMHKCYPIAIKKHLPNATHLQVPSRKAIIAGQGELKQGGRDPLFSLNHTAAMFRANVCRLIRRTWCTSKRLDRLQTHLNIYTMWHNENILAKAQQRRANFPLAG